MIFSAVGFGGGEEFVLIAHRGFLSSLRVAVILLLLFCSIVVLWFGYMAFQEQDYYFVREFVRFVASLLLKVPRDAPEQELDVILGGLTALESEISWFREEANFWQVFLEGVTPLHSNKEYCA